MCSCYCFSSELSKINSLDRPRPFLFMATWLCLRWWCWQKHPLAEISITVCANRAFNNALMKKSRVSFHTAGLCRLRVRVKSILLIHVSFGFARSKNGSKETASELPNNSTPESTAGNESNSKRVNSSLTNGPERHVLQLCVFIVSASSVIMWHEVHEKKTMTSCGDFLFWCAAVSWHVVLVWGELPLSEPVCVLTSHKNHHL